MEPGSYRSSWRILAVLISASYSWPRYLPRNIYREATMSPPPPQPARQCESLSLERAEIQAIRRLLKRPPSLARYFAVGEQLRLLRNDRAISSRGTCWRGQVAKLTGCKLATLNKCFQLRRCYKKKAELREVEAMGVGWGRLTIALGVRETAKRHALLAEAKEKEWKDWQLQREIQQRKGRRRKAGRKPTPPVSQGLVADVSELTRRTGAWNLFYEEAWAGNATTYKQELAALAAEDWAGMDRMVRDALAAVSLLVNQSLETVTTLKALWIRVCQMRTE